jgi:hypothetical protein
LASVRISANTSNGNRIEIRRSPFGVFSMYPFYHTCGYAEVGRAEWLKPAHASPLPLKRRGLRRAKTPFLSLVIGRGSVGQRRRLIVLDDVVVVRAIVGE